MELEPGCGVPSPRPEHKPPLGSKEKAIHLLWPVICFVVLGSTIVHGLSTVVISLGGSIARSSGERAPLLGQETDALEHMDHDVGDGGSEPDVSGTDED